MFTAGVVIDSWKLSIFQKHLKAAGYTWTEHKFVEDSSILLKVQTEWAHTLQLVVEAAQAECAASKGKPR